LLRAGCDKVSINSAALREPQIVAESSAIFGGQCIVVAIDARRTGTGFEVVIDGGRTPTGKDAVVWAAEAERLGAGELLVTSIDADGTKAGFDIALTRAIRDATKLPVIASGGAGSIQHFITVFEEAGADAALAASLFHYGEIPIERLKDELGRHGIPIRPNAILTK
jgi:cyclase